MSTNLPSTADYDSLVVIIQTAITQSIPQTIYEYITYVETLNGALSNLINLELTLEKSYLDASPNDIMIIDHLIKALKKWRIILENTITSIHTMFPEIKEADSTG